MDLTIHQMLQALNDQEISPQEFQSWLVEHLNDHPDELGPSLTALKGSPVYERSVAFLKHLTPDTELLFCRYPRPTILRPSAELLSAIARLREP